MDEAYGKYLMSREWALKRNAVIVRAHGMCERCGQFEASQIHHLTYIRLYRECLSDLQGLCPGCHQFLHAKSHYDPILSDVGDSPITDGEFTAFVLVKLLIGNFRENAGEDTVPMMLAAANSALMTIEMSEALL